MRALPIAAKVWSPDQLKLQAWLALPSSAREPRSQRELAKQLERDEATLSDWKRLPGFADAVYALALDHVKHALVPVLYAQVREAKRGSLPHAQWVFEVTGLWTPTSRQQHGNVPGETFEVVVQPKPWRETLAPFLPSGDDGDDFAP